MVLLLNLSEFLPQSLMAKMPAICPIMAKAMMYESGSSSDFIIYTVKNGVAILSENDQKELNTSNFL